MTAQALRGAYDAAAGAWAGAPDRVFGALAAALLVRGPDWRGLLVLDVGAGTGTATRRLAAAGAKAVPTDAASGMLLVARERCECSPVVGDARALPIRSNAVDAAVMGFVLNHLTQPADALAEAARVVRPGGWVLASTWAREDDHPVRHLVEQALTARGWRAPVWYVDLRQQTAILTDTADGLSEAARAAGLREVEVAQVDVDVPLPRQDLIDWRLGMPHSAPFFAQLSPKQQQDLRAELARIELPPLVCSTVMLVARV